MPVSPGTRCGPYEIAELVGRGGMGEVYRARDLRLGRDVAIKILPDKFSADRDRLRRFEQEARAAALLNHANVVSIYDVGTHDGKPYVVSELLQGQTLRAILAGGALPVEIAIRYALQLCQGLAAAHARGIVHRDLKPENLFITSEGRLKILDFGLAKLVKRSALPVASETTSPGTSAAGAIVGTIDYMSPEQLLGGLTDHRSDIFSLGAILYEMITGRRAFLGGNSIETMYAILKTHPPSFSRAGDVVRNTLDAIVSRCLKKEANDRYQTVGEIFKVRGAQLVVGLSTESETAGEATTISEQIGIEEEKVSEPHWTLWLGPWLGLGLALLWLITLPIWTLFSRAERFVILLLTVSALHLGGAAVRGRSPNAATVIHCIATLSLGVAIFVAIQIFDLEGYWPIGILLWALGAWTGWKLLDDATHFGMAAVLAPVGLAAGWELLTRHARPHERLGVIATGLFLIALAYFMAPDDKQFAWRGRLLRWIGGLSVLPAAFVLATADPVRELGTPFDFIPLPVGSLPLGWTVAVGAPTAVAVVLRQRAAWMNAVAAGWAVVAVAIPVEGPATALLLMIWFAVGALALCASGVREAQSERINVGAIILVMSLLWIAGIAGPIVGWPVVPLAIACIWFLERGRRRLMRAAMG